MKQWKTWDICTILGPYEQNNLTLMPDIVTISRTCSDYVDTPCNQSWPINIGQYFSKKIREINIKNQKVGAKEQKPFIFPPFLR
jgi:hypothetical protein